MVSGFWKYVYIFLAAALVGTVGFFTYRYIESYNGPSAPILNSIPPDAAFFLEIEKPENAIATLLQDTEIWKELNNIPEIGEIDNEIRQLDSLIHLDETTVNILGQSQMVLAVCPVDSGRFGVLYVVSLPSSRQKLSVQDFIRKHAGSIHHYNYKEIELSRVNLKNNKTDLHFSEYKGLLLLSFHEKLIKKGIDRLDYGNSLGTDASFKKVQTTAGKNALARFYLKFSAFSGFTANILDKNKLSLNSISGFADWVELDVVSKPRQLLLNGFGVVNDSVAQYLGCFAQEPQQVIVPEILPYDVSLLLDLGFADFESYLKKYTDYLYGTGQLEKFDKDLISINKKYGVKLQKQFFPLVGSEVGMALPARPAGGLGSGKDMERNCYVFFKAKDIKKTVAFMDGLASKVSRKHKKNLYEKEHNEYVIRKLDIPEFATAVFGPWFSCMKGNYFITIKDYVVMANKPSALIHLIDAFYLQKTLSGNYNFQVFSDNISESSNILFYCNTRKSFDYMRTFWNEPYSKLMKENSNSLKSFEAFAIQFSYVNNMFYTNFYLKYNPEFKEVNPSNWEVALDAKIIGKPHLLRNFKTGNLNVLVADELNNLYCIDPDGMVKWKTPIPEAIQSDVFPVDYYKNDKLQFLFNTENYLCLYDVNGNQVEGFPHKLIAKATNGLSVFDYGNSKKYRLLLGLEDNRIYNYSIDGKLVEGWKKIKARSTVTFSVEHLVSNKKDYIFVVDDKGQVIITNRRGEVRVRLRKKLIRAKNSRFYKNETNRKGIFITTNNKGKLTYVSASGKLKYTGFGDFSPEHFFFYDDFDGDGSKDFIFVDKDRLMVFNKFKKVLLRHQFNSEIIGKPVLFTLNGENHIGIIEPSSNEVLIFNKSGRAFAQQKFTGETIFVTGSLNNNSKTNLIICSGDKVMNYLLEE
ncbi:MAG: hypothetical protein GXO89_02450 [Chlorobi bacterium]|nr:hypothetical protein [Chlorobiota bacterium]